MSFPLTNYAPGLFAPTANTYGNLFLSQAVTTTNFNGMPMVGVYRGLGNFATGAYDASLVLHEAFVERFPGGLVVVDDDFVLNGAGGAYLRRCFAAVSPLLSSDHATAPVVATDVGSTPTVYAGLFMTIFTWLPEITPEPSGVLAWNTAVTYSRTTQNTPWGSCGLEAVTAFTDWDCSPPYYFYGTASLPPYSLDDLYNRMRGQSVTTTQLVQRVEFFQDSVTPTRPGLTRQINPVLANYLGLRDPNL